MENNKLVKIVSVLDKRVSKKNHDLLSIIREINDKSINKFFDSFEAKGGKKREVVSALNLFFAKKFADDRVWNDKMTPPVVGDLVALISNRLGLIKRGITIVDPNVIFPDFIFQFLSHFNLPFFASSSIPEVRQSTKYLSNLYNFNLSKEQNYNLLISRFSEKDFKEKSGKVFGGNLIAKNGYAILLINNQFLQNKIFIEFLQIYNYFQLIGIIKLPENFFVNKKSSLSLLILKRKVDNKKVDIPVLLSQMPELSNRKNFSVFLSKLSKWKKII